MGFSVIRTPNTWEFKVNWSAATVRLSQYVTYENGSREFRLFLPAGMAVYWIMKNGWTGNLFIRSMETGKPPQRSMETGNLARRSVVTGNLFIRSMKTRNPASGESAAQTREPGPKKRADQEPGRRSVQTGTGGRKPARNSVRMQTEDPGVYLNCLKAKSYLSESFLGEFGERF